MSFGEKFLARKRKQHADVVVKEMSLGLIKDSLISTIYAMKLVNDSKDIVDIDIVGLTSDMVPLKIYIKKEVSKTSK